MQTPVCPKCQGTMEKGMSVEYKSPGGLEMNINIPKAATWGKGTKPGFFINSVDKEIAITTYRCENCGYLESYAKNEDQEDTSVIKKTVHNG